MIGAERLGGLGGWSVATGGEARGSARVWVGGDRRCSTVPRHGCGMRSARPVGVAERMRLALDRACGRRDAHAGFERPSLRARRRASRMRSLGPSSTAKGIPAAFARTLGYREGHPGCVRPYPRAPRRASRMRSPVPWGAAKGILAAFARTLGCREGHPGCDDGVVSPEDHAHPARCVDSSDEAGDVAAGLEVEPPTLGNAHSGHG